MKASNGFCLQIDESTVTNGKCHLIGFIRFINNDNINIEQFFCCNEMKETTTGIDTFNIIDSYIKLLNLSWEHCFGICTDRTPRMIGSIKGLVLLAKKCNKNILATHCFLYREALIPKTIGPQIKMFFMMWQKW